jgi:putative NADH-flavin reductase
VATVLVIGASKGIGLETVKAALEASHTVRAMARSAGRIRIRNPNLERISGDALDHTAVKAALEGVDAVVQTLGVAAGPGMMLKPVRLFSDATGCSSRR